MENNENIPSGTMPEFTPRKVSPFEDSPYVIASEEASAAEQAKPVQAAETWTAENLPPVDSLPKKKSTGKVWKTIISLVAVVALVVTACGVTAFSVNQYWLEENAHSSALLDDLQQQIKNLEDKIESNSFTGNGNSISGTVGTGNGLTPGQVYAQNHRSVVAISNQTTANIFGQVTETASSGSGFIISEDGYIITNYHVVENATTLTVITSDGSEHPAKLIGYDDSNDFALIKVEATGLPTVTLGRSDDLIVGDQVVAIGNPLGELTNSLTVGYISAKERDVTTDGSIINMLQTDAAINPGNSGGPLFNMKGEVIGITSAKYSGTTSSGASIEGIGFAIPIDDVIGMVQELIENGYISAPYMGVRVSQRADGMGVFVEGVDPDTPASAAGIQTGDIIVGIGEYTVTSLSELDKALRNFSAHETATVFVFRNRQVLELSITFAEKNQTPVVQPTQSELPQDASAEEWYNWWLPNFDD